MKTKRLEIRVTERIHERLLNLKIRTGAGTMTRVFRAALALYESAMDCRSEGGKVVFVYPDGKENEVDL